MRIALVLALVAAACASSGASGDGRRVESEVSAVPGDAAGALARLAVLEERRTWPSRADRERWDAALDRAHRAASGLAWSHPVPSPDLAPALEALEQMDALFRVGESARARR